jgi:NitT/TauT family transport system permease protein
VAIPAALPNVFVGLFMGLASFSVLIVAEMVGVKSGSAFTSSGRRAGRPIPICTPRCW